MAGPGRTMMIRVLPDVAPPTTGDVGLLGFLSGAANLHRVGTANRYVRCGEGPDVAQ